MDAVLPVEDFLVDAGWLRDRLGDPFLRPVECGGTREGFDAGHIPGACHFDWDGEMFGAGGLDTDDDLYFYYLCARKRIRPQTACVFYGVDGDGSAWKLLEIFKSFGHERVKILAGGREAWIYQGLPLNFSRENFRRRSIYAPAAVVSMRGR